MNVCRGTYTGESDTAVTALGGGTGLLLIEPSQATTRGLDDASPVGLGVVRQTAAVSETLSHLLHKGGEKESPLLLETLCLKVRVVEL